MKEQVKNLSFRMRLSERTKRQIEELAANEKRTKSNMIETMIDREHAKLRRRQSSQ
jgi:predicted transcriptional regulator